MQRLIKASLPSRSPESNVEGQTCDYKSTTNVEAEVCRGFRDPEEGVTGLPEGWETKVFLEEFSSEYHVSGFVLR